MVMFKKILIANDGSEGARKALTAAIQLATTCSAERHSISVEEDLPQYVATGGEFEEMKAQRNGFFEGLNAEAAAEAAAADVKLSPTWSPATKSSPLPPFCKEAASTCWSSASWATAASSSAFGAALRRRSPAWRHAVCWW